MWKRRLMSLRSWRTTLIELLIPLLFLVAFNAPGLSKPPPTLSPSSASLANQTTALGMMSSFIGAPVFPSIGPYSATYIPSNWDNRTTPGFMYYPNTSQRVERIMKTMTTNILSNALHSIPLYGFAAEEDMVRHYEAHPMTIWAGISFYDDGVPKVSHDGKEQWKYSVRINGSYVPSTNLAQQTVFAGHLGGADSQAWVRYHSVGFLLVQWAVDQAIAHEISASSTYVPPAVPKDLASLLCFADSTNPDDLQKCNVTANVGYRRLPFMQDSTLTLLWIFKWLPGWCLNVASVFFFSSQLSPRIRERQHRLPLSLMGMSDVASQCAHFCTSAIFSLPLAILYTLIWHLVNVTYFSNNLLVGTFLFLYLLSMSSFAATLSPLLQQADRSVQTIFLFCFAFGLAYVVTLVTAGEQSGRGNGVWKLVLASVPFGAAHLGGELILDLEERNLGITLETISSGGLSTGSSDPSFVELLSVLSASILFWWMVGFWLSAVLRDPDQGERRSCCFCLETVASCSSNANKSSRAKREMASPLLLLLPEESESQQHHPHHEKLSAEQATQTLVSVRSLTKIYHGTGLGCGGKSKSTNKVAVDNLSFSLQRNQIFCLLGHNVSFL